jgi:uncharacterized protein (TIGR03435 family)
VQGFARPGYSVGMLFAEGPRRMRILNWVFCCLTLATIAIATVAAAQSISPPKSTTPLPSAQAASEPLPPMPADADPSFEVATIKPSDTSAPHGTYFRHNGRHVLAYNISVGELITYAYGLHTKQIVDGPAPLLGTHFDIDGLPDIVGHASLKQSQAMFQKLLVSRFKLAFRYESRELPAYAIQIAQGGPKLSLTVRKSGDSTGFSYDCKVVLTVRNASVADIAKGMQEVFMDRPVVDQTGLRDRYDFDLKWTPDESDAYCPRDSARSPDDADAPPGLYTAIQEQLGLKLVRTKAPIEVMVINHLEKPSGN